MDLSSSSRPHNCCNREPVNRGLWMPDEDEKLRNFMMTHAAGSYSWSDIPLLAGLQRCGKSCRFRWMNHLRPDLKRGNITDDEASLIHHLQKTIGNKWVEIAAHLPGRSDSEVKNYWHSTVKKLHKNKDSSPSTTHVTTYNSSIDNNTPQQNYHGNPNFNYYPQFGQFSTPSPQFNHYPVMMNFGTGELSAIPSQVEPPMSIDLNYGGEDNSGVLNISPALGVNAEMPREFFTSGSVEAVDLGPTIDGAGLSSELVVPEHEFPDDITAVEPLENSTPTVYNFPPAAPTSGDRRFLGGDTFSFSTDDLNWGFD